MSEAEKHKIRFYEHNPWRLRNDSLIKAYTNTHEIDISHKIKDA